LFVNGALDDQASLPENHHLGRVAADFRIPANTGRKQAVKFLVDELQWYTRALDASEIKSLYAAGSAGLCYGGKVR
jgi:hypothetical protein